MKRLEKALVLGAAGLAAYAIARRATRCDPEAFFRGRAVAVTGGASGIGREIVDLLWRYGARVLVVDVDAEAIEQLRSELPRVVTLEIDLAERSAPQRLVATAVERLGGLDVVFSNAGIIWAAPFLSMTSEDIERLIDVNLTMQVRLTRELVPYFQAHGGGIIAYTGSLSAYVYSPMHSVYTGTKGGLNNFVAAVRRELPAGSNVQLTIVHPNMTRTGLVDASLFDEVNRSYWLQTPEQVAAAFLEGVADGRREVYVEVADHLFVWTERLAPGLLTALFRSRITDELREKAVAAVPSSKIRRLARGGAS